MMSHTILFIVQWQNNCFKNLFLKNVHICCHFRTEQETECQTVNDRKGQT
jgi:hypothetical protein